MTVVANGNEKTITIDEFVKRKRGHLDFKRWLPVILYNQWGEICSIVMNCKWEVLSEINL